MNVSKILNIECKARTLWYCQWYRRYQSTDVHLLAQLIIYHCIGSLPQIVANIEIQICEILRNCAKTSSEFDARTFCGYEIPATSTRVRERRHDADMNGMRCYYRSIFTDNSLRRVASRGEIGEDRGRRKITEENSRALEENLYEYTQRPRTEESNAFPWIHAFFYDASSRLAWSQLLRFVCETSRFISSN